MNVLQDWVTDLRLMQQTVLLTAIRGPDGIPKYHPVKSLLRWYRRCVLLSALDKCVWHNPHDRGGGSFTGPSFDCHDPKLDWRFTMDKQVDEYVKSLDELPHHFQLHFLHAIEILGYKHPVKPTQLWWGSVYVRLVHDMHLWPESEVEMDSRLSDDTSGWMARNDRATIA